MLSSSISQHEEAERYKGITNVKKLKFTVHKEKEEKEREKNENEDLNHFQKLYCSTCIALE